MSVVNRVTAQEGAAGIATAVAESVQYQGRKASRQGSEQRARHSRCRHAHRRARWRAAVRHRAVAAEAGVPLSATTYYFKDIDDLLTDTFAQYVERSAAAMAKLWVATKACCVRWSPGRWQPAVALATGRRHRAADRRLRHRQLVNRREHLMAEQAFRQEAAQPAPGRAGARTSRSCCRAPAVFSGIGLA
jgi:DNA-binding transcriptional regulator YbjK